MEVGLLLFYIFCVSAGVFQVYLVLAYVDVDWGFLLCVYKAGLHEFYGR